MIEVLLWHINNDFGLGVKIKLFCKLGLRGYMSLYIKNRTKQPNVVQGPCSDYRLCLLESPACPPVAGQRDIEGRLTDVNFILCLLASGKD